MIIREHTKDATIMGAPLSTKEGMRSDANSMTDRAIKIPINAQTTGRIVPMLPGFSRRYPKRYATGYGRYCHGGGGTKGLMKRSMSKVHFLGSGDGIEFNMGASGLMSKMG